ncbi:unnamed protein product [Cylindrotheca closterium]|uniref:DUF6824 domain-containing protein n=1 Tax=Cylindrotheca closterium TaxID=2856 RepID=A0AAD2JMU5_9STRA|nr:unnamed protein product [Cylindrotheca closterium]
MNMVWGKKESSKHDDDDDDDDNKRITGDVPANMKEEDNLDSLIAGALNQLSINEREHIYQEMHGVDDIVNETPVMLQRSMMALHTELERLKHTPSHNREGLAFNTAEAISRNYVNDPFFRIKFLRSEKFDVKKSAARMIKFFDTKMQLFGKEKLCKDITLDDLNSDDMALLKSGYLQLLPTRDRSGRVALMMFFSERKHKVPENVARVVFYLIMTAVEDGETQQRGVTSLSYSDWKFDLKKFDLGTLNVGAVLEKCLPVKTCSHHVCFSQPEFRFIVNTAVYFMHGAARARIKLHWGTHMEVLYELMAFGIPVDSVPVSTEGELKRKNHLDFLKMRQRQESMVGAPRIVIPTHKDVLFGRGKPFREHQGNIILYEMIDSKLEYYESASTKQKTAAITEMVDAVNSSGGRFLKQDVAGCWMAVDPKMAKEKVSNTFRTRRRIASSENEDRKNSEFKVVSEGKKRFRKVSSDVDM